MYLNNIIFSHNCCFLSEAKNFIPFFQTILTFVIEHISQALSKTLLSFLVKETYKSFISEYTDACIRL